LDEGRVRVGVEQFSDLSVELVDLGFGLQGFGGQVLDDGRGAMSSGSLPTRRLTTSTALPVVGSGTVTDTQWNSFATSIPTLVWLTTLLSLGQRCGPFLPSSPYTAMVRRA
jgi:hypothetical protein